MPRWLPSEPFDAREDWDGSYASTPDVPIHVGAASWLGKPVWFEVIGPWRRPTRVVENPTAGGRVARDVAIAFIVFTVLVGTAFSRVAISGSVAATAGARYASRASCSSSL